MYFIAFVEYAHVNSDLKKVEPNKKALFISAFKLKSSNGNLKLKNFKFMGTCKSKGTPGLVERPCSF